MLMVKVHFSKLDVARRELETAIKFFFEEGDPVSIHVLATASHEILEALCKEQGTKSFIQDGLDNHIKPEFHETVRQKLRAPQNFFKHADRDAKELLEFNTEITAHHIWDCCTMYHSLTKERPKLMHIFNTWFFAKIPLEYLDANSQGAYRELKKHISPENRRQFFQYSSQAYDLMPINQARP